MSERTYIAIDLKSFYASVECVDRKLDPLLTNLVVADESRTEKTICLAVSPSLKAYGIPGRARLFEVVEKVRSINQQRRMNAPNRRFANASWHANDLSGHPETELTYIVARPRMARYMEVSSKIYNIYLNHVAPTDIHVYSIDEVFIDATQYLALYKTTARDFTMKLVREVLANTGITATAGIGTNLFLAKVAMDIVAKHIPADSDGVRIAELDEMSFRRQLWSHQPLTDFWRVGYGTAFRLQRYGMFTMGDVARVSVDNEEMLYKLFGINAELLIDHAWGWEPCTIRAIQQYRPENNSLSTGQVLQQPYDFEKAKLVAREMADSLVLDLVDKGLVTDHVGIVVGYDVENLSDPERRRHYHGPVHLDHYGRFVPKGVNGGTPLGMRTSSSRIIVTAVAQLFDKLVDKNLLVRRLNVIAFHVIDENRALAAEKKRMIQPDLFQDNRSMEKAKEVLDKALAKEKRQQEAVLEIRRKLGKNAILKGMNLEEGATARERNRQVGGHRM
ncbi:MAG: DNA methylase [Lentisphaeria bacterium]|nr:DNA methylase [Lentisphaeria bacterium]